MTKELKNKIIINAVAAAVFALLLIFDLLSKQWAVNIKPDFYLFTGCGLTLTYNSGMAFSMFDDNKVAMIVIIVITCVVMAAIFVAFVKTKKSKFLKIILAVIEAGAIGNLVDRIMWLSGDIPGVRDFIDISFMHFGVCNIADFCVTIGGVALLIYILFFSADPLIPVFKKKKTESDKKDDGGE